LKDLNKLNTPVPPFLEERSILMGKDKNMGNSIAKSTHSLVIFRMTSLMDLAL